MAKLFTVAKGKSITTKAGIKQHGDEVTAKIISGGEESFKELVEKDVLVAFPAKEKAEAAPKAKPTTPKKDK